MQDSPLYDVRQICDLKEMLAASVDRFRDNPAFLRKQDPSSAYQPVSFRQFQSDVNAFGTALLDLGQQGMRIAVIGPARTMQPACRCRGSTCGFTSPAAKGWGRSW
jgi:long-chain acyl-CoA synthetase